MLFRARRHGLFAISQRRALIRGTGNLVRFYAWMDRDGLRIGDWQVIYKKKEEKGIRGRVL